MSGMYSKPELSGSVTQPVVANNPATTAVKTMIRSDVHHL